jgi:hypothetical protein
MFRQQISSEDSPLQAAERTARELLALRSEKDS